MPHLRTGHLDRENVCHDAIVTTLPANGAILQRLTSDQDTANTIAQRQGGAEYRLLLENATVATGELMFHYNVPYSEICMETVERSVNRRSTGHLVRWRSS